MGKCWQPAAASHVERLQPLRGGDAYSGLANQSISVLSRPGEPLLRHRPCAGSHPRLGRGHGIVPPTGDPAKPIAPSERWCWECQGGDCSRGEDRNGSCCFVNASAWPDLTLWEYADETGPKSKALSFCESSVRRVPLGKRVFLLARQCFVHPRVEPVPEHPQPARPRRGRGSTARARCPPAPPCPHSPGQAGPLWHREPQQPGKTFLFQPQILAVSRRANADVSEASVFAEQRRAPRPCDDSQLSQHSDGDGVSFGKG